MQIKNFRIVDFLDFCLINFLLIVFGSGNPDFITCKKFCNLSINKGKSKSFPTTIVVFQLTIAGR